MKTLTLKDMDCEKCRNYHGGDEPCDDGYSIHRFNKCTKGVYKARCYKSFIKPTKKTFALIVLLNLLRNHKKEKMVTKSDKLIKAIKENAVVFAIDNLHLPTGAEILMIESAMLIGANTALELEITG